MTNDRASMTGRQIRELCRAGRFDRPTPGAARGYAQANLVVLRASLARSFEKFCSLNAQACPVLEVTASGRYEAVQTAVGSDLRTDLPRYRVYQDGRCTERPTDILRHWPNTSSDLVGFLIGCSFTFEAALIEAGIPVRHVEQGCNVPMYRTNVACRPASPFRGPLIVSMRPMSPAQAELARRITARCPRVHGAPIHIGEPEALGIRDLSAPDYGDPVEVRPDEVPVFWACGVTPMEAIICAQPDLAITHEPGYMFVTDAPDRDLFDPE